MHQKTTIQENPSLTYSRWLRVNEAAAYLRVSNLPALKKALLHSRTAARTPEDRALVDRATDAEASRLIREGHATPEERALLEQHGADMEAVNREEDAALSVLACIMEAF